jgi:hypothetical protein
MGLRGEFNGPKGIFLNAHGDPTPSDADRPAKEGAASGHLRPWKRKSGDCGQSWSRSSHNAGYFSVCYRSSAGAVAMIRTGLFLRTIAGVVMLSASSGSLRAQAYEGEAEVSTPSAEPMPIMPLELGPPLPPLPPPMAPHFAVTTHVAAGARMLVEIELLDLGPHGDGGAATITKVTVDGEVRCVWSEDLTDIRKPMVVGDRRYIHVDKACPGKRIALFFAKGAAAYAHLSEPVGSAAKVGTK